jgi:CO/xanthine dehydrogenase Mo-binding subunit
MRVINLHVNGTTRRVEVDAERSLLSVLRDELDLTGAKYGCGEGQCGACTVLVAGRAVRACVVAVHTVAGQPITTIEGLEQQGRLQLVRLVTAFECGAIVNPDGLKNQVEGAVIQAIGGALFETVEFADGQILNPDFARYRVPRFSDVPALETLLLDRPDLPSAGAGECPIVAVAPAVANAIFHATGVRLRALPLMPRGRSGPLR